jgi:DNA-3-methyladenine glycosylase II
MRLKNSNGPDKAGVAIPRGMVLYERFDKGNFHFICDYLAEKDIHLRGIIDTYGYPPMWTRSASFPTLIHIILEQQVSLASAKAAFIKLKQTIGRITPQRLLALSDTEMRACYFSRQKMLYARHLAAAILSRQISLGKLTNMPEPEIRKTLTSIKGIGNWTVDVYLMFALQRTDVFPIGDLAMLNAFREIKQTGKDFSADKILSIAERWRPYRSIAAMLLWHHYIQRRGLRI